MPFWVSFSLIFYHLCKINNSDLNDDFMADLFITTTNNFEIWLGSKGEQKFIYNNTIEQPPGAYKIGQSQFIDLELRGKMDLITPVCYDRSCRNSSLLVYSDGEWHNLQVKSVYFFVYYCDRSISAFLLLLTIPSFSCCR